MAYGGRVPQGEKSLPGQTRAGPAGSGRDGVKTRSANVEAAFRWASVVESTMPCESPPLHAPSRSVVFTPTLEEFWQEGMGSRGNVARRRLRYPLTREKETRAP